MFDTLSKEQQAVVNFDTGKIVIKACPGSGKTFSVAARIAKLIRTKNFPKKGIAALSFTNVACDEIRVKLRDHFELSVIGHPHFVNTLDHFINYYIFLPYGSLIMKCSKRPTLVGEPHSIWSVRRVDRHYYQYFDKTSFDSDDKLIRLAPHQAFGFTWRYFNNSGAINGNISNIIKAKWELFNKGYATQADANYIALKVLQKFPLIAANIAKQFEYFIIDEAQDTDETVMKIVDILVNNGADNFMLIGDPDQSIFEWNNAKPELFNAKYENWGGLSLKENRRSSKQICSFTNPLSSFHSINSVNPEVRDIDYIPKILGYRKKKKKRGKPIWEITPKESKDSFNLVLNEFLSDCEKLGVPIDHEHVAVLYRGNSKLELLGVSPPTFEYKDSPWLLSQSYLRTIIKGLFLYEQGQFKTGFRLLEKGLLESHFRQKNNEFNATDEFIQKIIDSEGFNNYRRMIFQIINILPSTNQKSIAEWVADANSAFIKADIKIKYQIADKTGNELISAYFGGNNSIEGLFPYYTGTVHSAKGKTFDAVLLILDSKQTKNYSNIMFEDMALLEPKYQEEMRIVYVGLTRPRKVLALAVPESDVSNWERKLRPE